jgi:hypothetical protein
MLLDSAEKRAAEWFLSMFNPPLARQGEKSFSRGELGSVWLLREGQREAVPLENPLIRGLDTELVLKEGQWEASCSCQRANCPHSYAAMLALLAHAKALQTNGDTGPPNGERKQSGTLLEIAEAKVGRELGRLEFQFLDRLKRFQERLRTGAQITYLDFNGIVEFYWYGEGLEEVREQAHLPPAEFWQEFALFSALRNIRLVRFFDLITDKGKIEQAIAEKKRREEIDAWKRTLAEVAPSTKADPSGWVDFAVMLDDDTVSVLIQTPRDRAFKRYRGNTMYGLLEQIANGERQVVPEALPIFYAFFATASDYFDEYLTVDEPGIRCLLGHLFQKPELQTRLLTGAMEPFKRESQPLRWNLSDTTGGDYKLQLVQANGKPARHDLTVLPGRPTLYLSQDTVFEGPPKPKALDDRTLRIPGPALESNEGLGLLHALALPIPSRIQARTRQVKLEVVIKCKVRTPASGNSEQCFVEFVAGSTDTGMLEHYAPAGWQALAQRNDESEHLYLFDRSALEAARDLPSGLGASWEMAEQCWRVRVTRNFPDKFLEWYQQVPKHYTFELDAELASLVRDPIKARVKLECEEVGVDWFDLRTTVNVDDTTLTPDEIRLLLNARGKAVRLEGKGWRRLEYELSEEEDQSLARLGLSPRDFSAEPQRLHALQLADRAAEKMLAADQYQRIRDRASEIKTRVTPDLPATITATLRPYQTDGFHFLSYLAENNFGGILADDMGLGKTLQTLTWIEWLRSRPSERKPSVVICPKSVMENWRSEASKFAPELKVQLWRGYEAAAFSATAAESDLLVLNYSQLRSLSEAAAKVSWHVVILDEAQYIKNPDSQTAQAARALRADHRLALSGTPIENRLLDLWSLMAFAMPGILGNRTEFRKRFDQQNDPFARRRLSARVRPFLLRRTKNQVASELPDRIEEDIVCEMEGTQKNLYRAEFKRAQQLLLRVQTQAELNEFRFNFLTSLLRLRQICCHPALVDEQHKNEESAKLGALIDLLEPLMEEGYKVLVFSQFVEMLQIIRERVQEQKWNHFYLDGSSEDRGELVDAFQNHQGPAVFLISLKAGGFGLNLTAASYVVLYDPWWNPAVENQAIDRTHRIGQTQKVIAYRLITKTSIEEKIRALQRNKSALAENVLGDESFASSLTIDDLRFLFEEDPTKNDD